ncbi:MAG TPA: hypothetical protein DEA96_05405 [Leptospiraceae bacterium]|jgi:hypothetical protein|nr:hypothetical protein [Spirochaetaceae bacterium]HBS04378.1 hypothetical protein [Leptospiraceae bacterium]|tara:strand:+ start:19203 stop:19454 length:252 start_codon:yes stop_codon:yes gene_type:complete
MIAIPDPRYGLVVYDNNVLEIFASNGESRRYHLHLIKSIELNEKKSYMEIKYSDVNLSQRIPFKPELVEQAQQMVAAIESAIK